MYSFTSFTGKNRKKKNLKILFFFFQMTISDLQTLQVLFTHAHRDNQQIPLFQWPAQISIGVKSRSGGHRNMAERALYYLRLKGKGLKPPRHPPPPVHATAPFPHFTTLFVAFLPHLCSFTYLIVIWLLY